MVAKKNNCKEKVMFKDLSLTLKFAVVGGLLTVFYVSFLSLIGLLLSILQLI